MIVPPIAPIFTVTKTTTEAATVAFKVLWAALIVACAWHIPAWEKAKDNHTEATYQMQQMWPQPFFGTQNKMPSNVMGNGGNFTGGNSGPIAE